MRKSKRVIDLLLIASIALSVFFLVSPLRPLIVVSGSMEPKLCKGDIIVGEKVGKSVEIRVNEIYSYVDKDTGCLITHRLVEKDDDGYVFKGDNNDNRDIPSVKKEQIKYHIMELSKIIGNE